MMPMLPMALRLPLLTGALVLLPVLWAWPEELPFWRSAGIVLGWAGAGLLLASLLLMLREVRLARWLGGLERMYRWHHATGASAYLLLAAHPLALALGLHDESPALAWAMLTPFADKFTDKPAILAGWLGLLGLMLGLAAAFSRRLDYRHWRALHWLLVAGIAGGLLHLQLLGIAAAPGFSLLLVAGLLLWRLLRADCSLAARPYLVYQRQQLTPDIVEIGLRPLAEAITARPGQFVLLRLEDSSNYSSCHEAHPFSLSAIDADGCLRLCIKALGDCTRHMQTLDIAVPARIEGPFGAFLPLGAGRPQQWFAGGIGITPFLAHLRAGAPAAPVHLHYFFDDPAAAAGIAELQAMAASIPGFSLELHPACTPHTNLAALLPEAAALTGQACYLCGPPGLVKALCKLLRQRGVAPTDIHFENFDFR